MIHKFKTSDHPEADGRIPQADEQQWTLSFLLDNGDDYLEISMGRRGREALIEMLTEEDKDDLAEGEFSSRK